MLRFLLNLSLIIYVLVFVGGHSMHTHEQYDLSVHDGAIHWIHRNEYDQQIFNVRTEPIVVKGIILSTVM